MQLADPQDLPPEPPGHLLQGVLRARQHAPQLRAALADHLGHHVGAGGGAGGGGEVLADQEPGEDERP